MLEVQLRALSLGLLFKTGLSLRNPLSSIPVAVNVRALVNQEGGPVGCSVAILPHVTRTNPGRITGVVA